MDGEGFDAFTKRLALGTSRRRVLTGLGGALAGALDRGAAAAGVGASCSADTDCIDGRCVNGHCRFGGTQTTCADVLRTCLDQAGADFSAARRACQAGPRQDMGSCVAQASATQQAAMAACPAEPCGPPPGNACTASGGVVPVSGTPIQCRGSFCVYATDQCCNGRCVAVFQTDGCVCN